MAAGFAEVVIPYRPDNPLPCGWLYIAWLAYPGEGEAQARQDLCEAFAACVYKAHGKHAPEPLRRFKKSKAESVARRGLARAGRRAFGAWVWLKHLDAGLSINAACDLATVGAGRADYDAATAPDTFATIWPEGHKQETPDKNARRSYYEARPVIPMLLAPPIFPRVIRAAICPGLEGIDLPARTMGQLAFSEDWIWKACHDANRIVDAWRDHKSFATATLIVPVERTSIL